MLRTYSGFFEGLKKQIIIIKVGTSSLLNAEQGTLRLSIMAKICEVVRSLHDKGHQVVIVTSGGVGVGCHLMGLKNRPEGISDKQAMAAVGQVHLMRYYEELFGAVGMKCAQVLVDNDVFAHRHQYLNTRNTFRALFNYGVVPVANENDTVAIEELRIGDNDTLSAKIAVMCEADWLFLLTDVPCLYSENPRDNPDAQPIHIVEDVHRLCVDTSTAGTQWGSGGMHTKLTAARLATPAGAQVAICSSADPENVLRILDGERVGTVFQTTGRVMGRKRWILSVPVRGSIWMDDGAVDAVCRHSSLFAAGIVKTTGDFSEMDCVSLCDKEGNEFAQALTNYSRDAMESVMGKSSSVFDEELIGYSADEMVFRSNICLMDGNAGSDDSSQASD